MEQTAVGNNILPPIESLIPQRHPFLFIDHILQLNDNYIVTEKVLTGEEEFFKGHFPGMPIMPGVLIQEAIFQSAAALMAGHGNKQEPPALGVIAKVENARFKKLVKPLDILNIEVTLLDKITGSHTDSNAFYFKGIARVGKDIVVSIQFTCMQVPASQVVSEVQGKSI